MSQDKSPNKQGKTSAPQNGKEGDGEFNPNSPSKTK